VSIVARLMAAGAVPLKRWISSDVTSRYGVLLRTISSQGADRLLGVPGGVPLANPLAISSAFWYLVKSLTTRQMVVDVVS